MKPSISEKHPLYYYISTKACYDPAKTIYVCPPEKDAGTYEDAERFAVSSGWQQIAEEDSAVLVIPIAKEGWKKESPTLLSEIFGETKGKFASQNGKSLWGRNGFLWCWETLVFLVGYGEGAVFAGNAVVATPGQFTAAALVNGVPDDYAAGKLPSGHFMVPKVSGDYDLKNEDIPSCLWLLLQNEEDGEEAVAYFSKTNRITQPSLTAAFGGISTRLFANQDEPIRQVRLSAGRFDPEPGLSKTIFHRLFERVIRWKCGPDGKLTPFSSKEDFYASGKFARGSVQAGGHDYDYLIHTPAGMQPKDVAGLPLVFSVHGRGEPAWMFAEKNGWDKLCDETREFVLVVPDSPENIWFLDRDGKAFGAMIEAVAEQYGIDRSRVYLTGFSNGGCITREVGTAFPSLFAGLSPWNAPALPNDQVDVIQAQFESGGWEMPYFFFAGDNDALALAETDKLFSRMLRVNHCAPQDKPDLVYTGEDRYTEERGYREGERMTTQVYLDREGVPKVALTVMKNMPHGAIHDESRAAWEFLRRFCRPLGSRKVELVPEPETGKKLRRFP